MVRSVPYADSDLIVSLFTKEIGKVSAIARRARSAKNRSLVLEPMHTLLVVLEERHNADLLSLASSKLLTPRPLLVTNFRRITIAGQALRWLREASALRSPEPALWSEIENFLDRLNLDDLIDPEALLVSCGLAMLRVLGYGLDLRNCVRCGRRCESGRSAFVEPSQGGLVCRACGGGSILIPGEMRSALIDGELAPERMSPAERDVALRLVDGALLAHVGIGAV